jgi:hypothetical protein
LVPGPFLKLAFSFLMQRAIVELDPRSKRIRVNTKIDMGVLVIVLCWKLLESGITNLKQEMIIR